MKNPPSRWFIIHSDGYFVLNEHLSLLDERAIGSLMPSFLRQFSLGNFAGIEFFCAEIDQASLALGFCKLSLRQALTHLPADYYGIGVKAYSVLNWDKNHQFCGRCGSPTTAQSHSFERRCISCDLRFFPRISPSIIVLIHKGNQILMARSPHHLPGAYGLIAGFVETGESLEQTVHREVEEEVGLKVKNLSYYGSQPWPFPDSLMIGFIAEYDSGEIQIDGEEIIEAGWYAYDNLPGRPSMVISIASKMLDYFIHTRLKPS